MAGHSLRLRCCQVVKLSGQLAGRTDQQCPTGEQAELVEMVKWLSSWMDQCGRVSESQERLVVVPLSVRKKAGQETG